MAGRLAVDFGTSNTVLALWDQAAGAGVPLEVPGYARLAAQRLAAGLRGSAGKTVHLLTSRYTLADIDAVPAAEVVIGEDGDITLTGIDPLYAMRSGHAPARPKETGIGLYL